MSNRFSWIAGLLGSLMVVGFLAHRYTTSTTSPTMSAIGGAGACLLLLYLWLDRESATEAAQSRQIRYSAGALVLVFLAACLTVTTNALAIRHDREWDVTVGEIHTLGSQSTQVLESLESSIQVVGFFQAGSMEQSSFEALLERFETYTDVIQHQVLDPVREPRSYRQFERFVDPGSMGSDRVVLIQGERYEVLSGRATEQTLIDALIRLVSGVEHQVCFTAGHGERGVDEDGTLGGYGAVIQRLEGQNYQVLNVALLRDDITACDLLVVAGAQISLMAEERAILLRHVEEGGPLLALLEPINPDSLDPLSMDLAAFGLEVGRNLVVEADPTRQLTGLDGTYLVLDESSFAHHEITRKLRHMVIMQGARSISATEVAGRSTQVLATTTENAWAETNPESLLGQSPAVPDQDTDPIGQIPLGAASWSSNNSSGGRVVVFGDADFPSNQFVLQGVGDDLFLNAISWLVGEEEQLAVRANDTDAPTLSATVSQMRVVWLISILGAPGLALFCGLVRWIRRRRL
mgnify:CR=1 FL=1